MKYKRYPIKVYDTNDNYLFDMPYTFPVYTVEEYNNLMATYNSQYASLTNKTVIYGSNDPGAVTAYGQFVLQNMGMQYYGAPLATSTKEDLKTEWLNLITEHFRGTYPFTDEFISIPVSASTTTWTDRAYTIKTDVGSAAAGISYYTGAADAYRAPNFTRVTTNAGLRGHTYGSGTGSNTDNAMYMVLELYYLVEDGRIGRVNLNGYYGTSPYLYGNVQTASATFGNWSSLIINSNQGEEVDPSDEDPYNNPAEGDFDDGSSDDVDFPSLPGVSAADTGFITLYNPSVAQLKNLANYMWSGAFDINTFKKLFGDPMDAILGLSIVPIAVPNGGTQSVKVGNVDTGVSLTKAASQFVHISCGSMKVKRESPGSYLDQAPYTKAEVFLPCIGVHAIDIDEIMNKTVSIAYNVDILSGACTAMIKVSGSVLYQFNGQCAISIPITGNDWTNVLNGAITVAASIGTAVATGGATAPMAAATIASAAVNNLKPQIEKSGAMGGAGGLLGVKRPYLILSRPNRHIPAHQNEYIGYPTYKTVKLGDISGYNVIEDIHLDNIPATAAELDEIEALLKSGVIL